MRRISYLTVAAAVIFSACNSNDTNFQKGKNGLEYKIISSGNGEKIKPGNFMQIHVGQYYNNGKTDSLLSDTRKNGSPLVELLDSASTPAQYYEVLSKIKNHDSLVFRILTDSAFASAPNNMPPFLKKGHYLVTTVKVLDIFKDRKSADSARMVQVKIAQQKDSIESIATMAKDVKTLEAYFTQNNIKVQKAPEGTYVEILQPGTGNNVDTTVIPAVNYTGRILGKTEAFDSNTDTSKGPKGEPLNVNMTTERGLGLTVIKGWTDGLKLLNKGAKARFYIPSPLAYGSRDQGQIPPNSILVFDIDVVDILSKEKARAITKEKMEKRQQRQKAYMDSLTKVKAKAIELKKQKK